MKWISFHPYFSQFDLARKLQPFEVAHNSLRFPNIFFYTFFSFFYDIKYNTIYIRHAIIRYLAASITMNEILNALAHTWVHPRSYTRTQKASRTNSSRMVTDVMFLHSAVAFRRIQSIFYRWLWLRCTMSAQASPRSGRPSQSFRKEMGYFHSLRGVR